MPLRYGAGVSLWKCGVRSAECGVHMRGEMGVMLYIEKRSFDRMGQIRIRKR